MQFSFNPVEPRVVKWFRWYCGFMCVVFACVALVSPLLLFLPSGSVRSDDVMAVRITSALFICLGVPLLVGHAVPLMVKRKRWMWVYGIILCIIGLTGGLSLIFAIIILVEWLKDETRRWFEQAN
jgi:hypothetical protein